MASTTQTQTHTHAHTHTHTHTHTQVHIYFVFMNCGATGIISDRKPVSSQLRRFEAKNRQDINASFW